jgi:predicted nucleic acid-binding protein
MIIIADSSALVALSICRILPLLETIFDKVYVPKAVYNEVCISGKPESKFLCEYLNNRVQSVSLKKLSLTNNPRLGIGELEAIALYLKTSADLLLIDDAYAKKIASQNGLEVMGSIGVLLLAKQKGLISTIKPLITMLVNSEIHLGNSVIQKALYLAKE